MTFFGFVFLAATIWAFVSYVVKDSAVSADCDVCIKEAIYASLGVPFYGAITAIFFLVATVLWLWVKVIEPRKVGSA